MTGRKRRYSLNKNSTKLCTQCGEYKNVAEFGWANKKRGWKSSECRHCARRRVEDYYKRKKAPIIKYLKDHPCVDCGESDWRVLEFDHIRGEKLFAVSNSWTKKIKDIESEIKKCDVRCKNCHAKRHWNEGWGGGKPISNKDAIEFYNIKEDEEPPQLQMKLFD